MILRGVILVFVLGIQLSVASAGQLQRDATEQTIRVFLDCAHCDGDYAQTEISFVEFVRDTNIWTLQAAGDAWYLIDSEGIGGFWG
jgi:hypothetical protein